jgi:prepilin-type N-terminal cleavage/methylation domain-containing protein
MRKKTTIANKEGFTLIEVIITFVVAAILAALFVNLMGPSLMKASPISAVRAQNHYALIGVVEKMYIDYNKLTNAGDPDVLGTLQSHIQAGNVATDVPYFGQYSPVTNFITFNAANNNTEQPSATATNTLKVTITGVGVDQTITTLFTK